MPDPTAPRPEGLPETMKPEDVPDDLADNAVDAWHEAPRNEHGLVILDDHMRYVLAAVLPAHERQVREQVADEIEARVAEHRSEAARLDLGDRADMLESIGVLAKADHLAEAARIARGES